MNLIPIVKEYKTNFYLHDKRKEFQSASLINFFLTLISFYDFSKKDAILLITELFYLLDINSKENFYGDNMFFDLTVILNLFAINNFYLYNSLSFTKSFILLSSLKKMKKYNLDFFSLINDKYKFEKNYKKLASIYSLMLLLGAKENKRKRSLTKNISLFRVSILKEILNKNLQKILEKEIQNSLKISTEKTFRYYKF